MTNTQHYNTHRCPSTAILLFSTKIFNLWLDPIFWTCAAFSFLLSFLCFNNQSDLRKYRYQPEVTILGADQNDCRFWEWDENVQMMQISRPENHRKSKLQKISLFLKKMNFAIRWELCALSVTFYFGGQVILVYMDVKSRAIWSDKNWCVNMMGKVCYDNVLTCCFAFFPLLPLCSSSTCCVCCRYRPSIPASFVESELGFTEDAQCLKFLQDLGVVFTTDGTKIDCKLSQGILAASWPGVATRPVPTWQVID